MKVNRNIWRLLLVLCVAAASSLVTVNSQAQPLVVHPPRIAIPSTANVPIVHPYHPAGPGAPAPAVQPARPLVVQAGPGCGSVGSQPAPIQAVVTALKCDPDLIFEYVYNNIEFEPLFGSNKGPLGTLLDRRGDDADQTMLLVSLWNAAGYTQTGYINVYLGLTGTDIANWLGVQNDAAAIEDLLNAGGIPWGDLSVNPDGTLASIIILHFQAALNIGGTWYFFDPSFKAHTILNGISNLSSALGYNRTQFLSDAGGTIGSVSISSINRSALRADLTSYATNLVNYINGNNSTASVGNVIGGKTIEPLIGSPIRNPGSTPQSTFPVDCPNETITVECRTYITILMPGASVSQAIKLYTDQVYGHRITVFSVPSGSNYVPTLLIDGAVPSCVGTGTCTNVGTAEPAGTTWSIPITVTEPNQATGSGCASGVTACKTLTIAAGGSYLISTGTGQVGRGMPQYHRQLLAQARAAGNADTSELVLGESLAVLGYTWLAEFSAEQQITDQLAGTTTLYQFGVGITGQSNINQLGYQGPYVDLPVNYVQIIALASNGPTTVVGPYTYPTAFVSAGFTYGEALSAFESAVLEQTQAPVSGMTAASTIKIVDANMNPSYSGALQTTYFADGTTCAGQTAFVNTIEPAISPNYNSSDYNTIVSLVMAGSSNCPSNPPTGAQVLIPKNGKLAVGLWTGAGYTDVFPQSSNLVTITQKISGGMTGGFSGVDIPDPTDNFQVTLPPPADTDTLDSLLNSIPAPSNPPVAEPVDGVTGAYVYQHTDLTTGSGRFPYALPFSRTYLSSSGTYLTTTSADTGLGNGWANNYGASAQVESDPYIGMGGSDSPAISAATSIAALYVMQDLLSVTPTAQTMTISSMVARWFTDQLTGNVVLVQQPNTTEEYVALPHADGASALSYNPPPGSSVQFNQTAAGQYTYARKDAVTLTFGPTPAGALQGWAFPNGMSVTLTYSGSELAKITNNVGRSIALSYSGNDIASVTDDTGRTVSYAYDSNHNLTAFTDPLGYKTAYAYDTSGLYDTFGHLTQVFYPSRPANPFLTNWYDPLGRVIQQANANLYTSDFYFAGSRSEIVDAVGNRHVTYQTDRGKVIKDAFVLSSTFGDVFNDTAQQNGLVNVTTNQYDGLDRLTLTTLPEGGTTAYAYATTVNPWANNIASITRTAKPGSPLSPLTASFTYDPIYNKPIQATDPLGLVATMSYDPRTGNLLNTVADAGGGGHFNATRQFTYDGHGRVLSATDPLGVVTAFSYDQFENLTAQVADTGTGHINSTTLYAHDALGNVIRRTDPNGNTTTLSYDANRRLLSTTAPPPFSGSQALVRTINSYDQDGKLLSITRTNSASPSITRFAYAPTGKVQSVTDPNGNVTTNGYDADDRLVTITDPLARLTVYGYDAMSRRTSVFNPAIQSNPLLQQSYTPDGLIGSLTDANGNTTSFSPDGFDRLSTTTYPDSSTENYSYDADDNVLSRQTRAGATLAFSYDTLNRLATKAPPSEATVTYVYDQASHLIGVSDASAAIAAPATSASYSTSYAYDQLNRPLTASWTPAPSQATPTVASASFAFGYDAINRRITQTATDNSWWRYPATATNVSYTSNDLNQYTAVGSVSPTYDGNGDLTYDGSFTYCYDTESRLTGIVTGSCGSPTSTVATYVYDAQGRRKSKTVGSTTTIYVTDADNREVLEYNGSSGAMGNWYSFAPANAFGPDAVLNQMNVASGTRGTLIPDVQGSIIGSLGASSGTLTRTGYQAYGENPSLTSGSFQYTARRFDPESAGSVSQPSGLYYYRARMYSPALGRFMQVDPNGMTSLLTATQAANTGATRSTTASAAWYVAAENFYGYVGNDPINNTDPNGQDPLGFAVGLVAGGIYGGIGAIASPNPSIQSVLVSTAVGAGIGGGLGALDLTGGITTLALIGGSTSGLGDVISQVTVNLLAGQPAFTNLNYGSIIGATIGGAAGGAIGGPVTTSLLNVGYSQLGATALSATITGGIGVGSGVTGAWIYSLSGANSSSNPSLSSSPSLSSAPSSPSGLSPSPAK